MGQRNATLGHDFYEISEADLEPQISANAEDDDFTVEMVAFEKIINVQHPSSHPPKVLTPNMPRLCRLGAVAGVVGICGWRNLQFVCSNKIGVGAPMEITP